MKIEEIHTFRLWSWGQGHLLEAHIAEVEGQIQIAEEARDTLLLETLQRRHRRLTARQWLFRQTGVYIEGFMGIGGFLRWLRLRDPSLWWQKSSRAHAARTEAVICTFEARLKPGTEEAIHLLAQALRAERLAAVGDQPILNLIGRPLTFREALTHLRDVQGLPEFEPTPEELEAATTLASTLASDTTPTWRHRRATHPPTEH